jgi:hypothetical protein
VKVLTKTRTVLVVLITGLAMMGSMIAGTLPAPAATRTVTNTAHLDFLLDDVSPRAIPGHTTYRLAQEPELLMPWTYADARPGGAFARVGGGAPDPSGNGYYGQGAFNADDTTRAAVVYLRHWKQFGDRSSKRKAYELLRSVAYHQTTTGPNRGNVVLWMQFDGTLNPSPEPKELPDPSDSDASYWLARSIWAFGEGYAAFERSDPKFARFLQQRLQLATAAVDRQVLDAYGRYDIADGRRVPAWLIGNGADASAEAALGLAAYLEANPRDRQARQALAELAEGIAAMSTGTDQWPYGAILPWTESRSDWHAWSSQMSVALAKGSQVLDRPQLLRPALKESVHFDTTLITAGGPDNGWLPTRADRVQIAYGVDSRVQSLLTVADVARRPGLRTLAAMNASWFFGTNVSGQPIYNPATGVTYDGVAPDGTINKNSGAESTIHGLLTMLALDAHPSVRQLARTLDNAPVRNGLATVEAEDAAVTSGTVITPEAAWTGESLYGGGKFLRLSKGATATFDLGTSAQRRIVEPVSWLAERGTARSVWAVGEKKSSLRHSVGRQGVTAASGALLPQRLRRTLPADEEEVSVRIVRGSVDLDAVITRPLISRAVFSGGGQRVELLHSAARRPETVEMRRWNSVIRVYDDRGQLVRLTQGSRALVLPGGFTTATR